MKNLILAALFACVGLSQFCMANDEPFRMSFSCVQPETGELVTFSVNADGTKGADLRISRGSTLLEEMAVVNFQRNDDRLTSLGSKHRIAFNIEEVTLDLTSLQTSRTSILKCTRRSHFNKCVLRQTNSSYATEEGGSIKLFDEITGLPAGIYPIYRTSVVATCELYRVNEFGERKLIVRDRPTGHVDWTESPERYHYLSPIDDKAIRNICSSDRSSAARRSKSECKSVAFEIE